MWFLVDFLGLHARYYLVDMVDIVVRLGKKKIRGPEVERFSGWRKVVVGNLLVTTLPLQQDGQGVARCKVRP